MQKFFTCCPKWCFFMRSSCSYFFRYCCGIHFSVKTSALLLEVPRSQAGYLNLHTDIPASREVNSVKCSFIWPVLKWKDVTWWGLRSFLKLPVRFRRCCCKFSVQAADTCSTAYSGPLLNPQWREESHLPQFPCAWRVVPLLISEISFPAVDLLHASAGRERKQKHIYSVFWGTFGGSF